MNVTIVLEAQLSSVVGTEEARGACPAVPYCVWAVVGEITRSDDDDISGAQPIQDRYSEVDADSEDVRPAMGSLAYEDFEELVRSQRAVRVIGPSTDLQACLKSAEALKALLDNLGHHASLFEVCDY